jgi:hypothetical protein
LLAVALDGAVPAYAEQSTADECLVGFRGDGLPPDGGTVSCSDCDERCDADGSRNGVCTFHAQVCSNLPSATCAPADIDKVVVRAKRKRRPEAGTAGGTEPRCGPILTFQVEATRRRPRRTGIQLVAKALPNGRPRRKDKDVLSLRCAPAAATCSTTSTTSTTTTTTTTTLPCGNGRLDPGEECDPAIEPSPCGAFRCTAGCTCARGCCAAERITTVSGPGILQVSTLPPFPFPAGVMTTFDASGPDPGCRHAVLVPAGGFTVPPFCIPSLGFTSSVTALGCESGAADGAGTLWDGAAPFPDADVRRIGDTSDAAGNACGTLGGGCNPAAGNAGFDTAGNVDVTRGDGEPDRAGVQLRLDIPVESVTWSDADLNCPDDDRVYDAGTDTLVTRFRFILGPTTASSSSDFVDLNGDGCSVAGNGPDHTKRCSNDHSRPCVANAHCAGGTCEDGPLAGVPAPGPCCSVGQPTTTVATGIAFSAGAPLYDLTFSNQTPSSVTACLPAVGGATCTVTTNSCVD